jgi:hypothetical protein
MVDGLREVVVYSKRGCHLCEAVVTEIRSMNDVATRLVVTNIDDDPELHDRYWLKVPVVRVDGEDVFEAEMMDVRGRWRRKLADTLSKGSPDSEETLS